MGKFELMLPNDIMQDFKDLNSNAPKIFEGMTQAGAKVVLNNVKANLPHGLKNSDFAKCIGVTKPYKTPTDGGYNTKVYISGYFAVKNGNSDTIKERVVPAPLVANAFEYGTSNRYTMSGAYRGRIAKQPFFRKSFKKSQIEKAMLKAQKELSGGLLDE